MSYSGLRWDQAEHVRKGIKALVIGEREFFDLLAFEILFWRFVFVIHSFDS